MNTKTIKFDLNKYKLYEKIKAKQGDTKSRFLLFQLLDGSIPFNLKNRSVRAYMVKPDGREIFNDLIVNNYNLGYCTLELTNQVLAVQGTVKIELMVTEEEKKLTSSVFELEVVKSINSEKSIVSTNEFTALLNGLAALSEYDNYKNAVKEMEINKADKAKVEEKFGEVYEQLDTTIKFKVVGEGTVPPISGGIGGGTGGGIDGDTNGGVSENISNASETAITQQYSTSHEATPNNPNPPAGIYNWVNAPRINPDGPFPQSHWSAIGHWMTTYKVQGSSYYDNVGLLLQDPKAWIWNTATKSWDILSDDFEYGTWYREDFWDDGSGNIAGTTEWETGVSANHSKWVKIKQISETSGRCFHPWGYQKNWRSNSNWSNDGQPYIVTKIDFKLVKYDEIGVDNLDKAQLVVNSGADWWRNVGDVWQPDWSTNRDMAVGKYILATKELKRAWCTNLPKNWAFGLPKDIQ